MAFRIFVFVLSLFGGKERKKKENFFFFCGKEKNRKLLVEKRESFCFLILILKIGAFLCELIDRVVELITFK